MQMAENEFLTRTDKGTPMGELWRRFWLPVMLSEELPHADCDPVRVRVLGEDLVAFRDSNGRPGMLEANCAHRGASLFFGRNEQGGLRCIYHGWKFDIEGTCLDMPNAPPDSGHKQRIRQGAYPCREQGGFVWAYLGPRDTLPEIPRLPFVEVPPDHRFALKMLVESNYLQALEGDIDNSHASILHGRLDPDSSLPFDERLRRGAAGRTKVTAGERANDVVRTAAADTAPVCNMRETAAGITVGWRRNRDASHYQWRINHWLMPGYALIGTGYPGSTSTANLRIPVDDFNSIMIRVKWNPVRPLADWELNDYRTAGIFFPEMIPGTHLPKENKGNDYLIDRKLQRMSSPSGIKGLTQQDRAVTDSMGPIADRTKENLLPSDLLIVQMRRRLMALATDLTNNGTVPKAAKNGSAYDINPADLATERGVGWEQMDMSTLASARIRETIKATEMPTGETVK